MREDRFFAALRPYLAPTVSEDDVRAALVIALQDEAGRIEWPWNIGLEILANNACRAAERQTQEAHS